jgi:hypothetical protein
MNLQFAGQTACFGWRKGMIKGCWGMGGEVIHHQENLFSVGVVDIDHFLHEMGPILARFLLGHLDHPFAGEGFARQKEVEHGSLLIALVVTPGYPRL